MKPRTATILRLIGFAGLAGVAATGVVIARDQRQRSQLSADEVRERLHARYADAAAASLGDGGHDGR